MTETPAHYGPEGKTATECLDDARANIELASIHLAQAAINLQTAGEFTQTIDQIKQTIGDLIVSKRLIDNAIPAHNRR